MFSCYTCIGVLMYLSIAWLSTFKDNWRFGIFSLIWKMKIGDSMFLSSFLCIQCSDNSKIFFIKSNIMDFLLPQIMNTSWSVDYQVFPQWHFQKLYFALPPIFLCLYARFEFLKGFEELCLSFISSSVWRSLPFSSVKHDYPQSVPNIAKLTLSKKWIRSPDLKFWSIQ